MIIDIAQYKETTASREEKRRRKRKNKFETFQKIGKKTYQEISKMRRDGKTLTCLLLFIFLIEILSTSKNTNAVNALSAPASRIMEKPKTAVSLFDLC